MQEVDGELESQLKEHVINIGLFRCPIDKQPPVIEPYTVYGYKKAQQYIENQLSKLGIPFYRQPVIDEEQTFHNIVVGNLADQPLVLLTAHYDTAFLCGGADDNGSSVAVLLEVLRILPVQELPLQVVFFTLEEGTLEYFRSQEQAWIKLIERLENGGGKLDVNFIPERDDGQIECDLPLKSLLGSKIFVESSKENLQQLKAVINLESVGYYSSSYNSQEETFNGSVPTTGDFLAILCNQDSIQIAKQALKAGEKADFPVFLLQEEELPGLNLFFRADHLYFWKEGLPAITFTDTLENRYVYYHLPLDLPEELDYQKMAQLVRLLADLAKTLVVKQD